MLQGRVADDFSLAVFGHHFIPRFIPARTWWHEKIFAGVIVWLFQSGLDIRSCHPLGGQFLSQLRPALIKQVTGALQKQHAENVFLVFAGIHAAAQIVTSGEQKVFEAGKGQLRC